ncbi:MAG: alanine--tRNA ligase [Candidatus Marinimicrobia bacterium]|nr:alanine--tRNA ligase [Candidatus Neomarinimicrobiota bacterium]
MISSSKVRQQFIDFFKSKEHHFVRSSPVFPIDDPTLLFTNAGMNQFKPIFLDQEKPKYNRVANSQKCIRASGKHNDLEEVGVDNYHHTFFEMLGNWSFGNYYKNESIKWAWELLTEVWKLDKSKLWVSIYKDDDETGEIWKQITDVDPNRILKFDKKENFWEMGETGPCGPCTEIHYYTGNDPQNQDSKGVNVLPEYREIWNLVFIQYNRKLDQSLENLPATHVDTGMGLERITAIINGYESNYDTDLFQPIIKAVEKISGKSIQFEDGIPHRVIADHLRMISFSIADGIMPGNEGRGYVVRRILRRALKFGRSLGLNNPFLHLLVDGLVEQMKDAFPEIYEKQSHVKKVILAEEKSFNRTLDKGLEIFENICNTLDGNIISGEDAFKLYDTYGFPLDLTELLAREKDLSVDISLFNKCMEQQRTRAREAGKFGVKVNENQWVQIEGLNKSNFIGYSENSSVSRIIKYRINKNESEIVLNNTPFYSESGGQVGDKGKIYNNDFSFNVLNTQKLGDDIIHYGRFINGKLLDDFTVTAEIDLSLRQSTEHNHTATHLLHKALKTNLGDHVNQAGSLVSPEKLRFDLTHYEQISKNDLMMIEKDVNSIILQNIKLNILETSFDSARKDGAEALFGEKYGDLVRVVDVPGYSKELCGGTHVSRTGDIGLFKIISESSLASGIRRIEAVTGKNAIDRVVINEQILDEISSVLNTSNDKVIIHIGDLKNKIKFLEKELNRINKKNQVELISDLMRNAIEINENKLIFSMVENISDLKEFGIQVLDKCVKKTAILLGLKLNNKPLVFCGVTPDLIGKIHAGNIVRELGSRMGGGGGGKPNLATAGGKDLNLLDDTLEFGKNKLIELLK